MDENTKRLIRESNAVAQTAADVAGVSFNPASTNVITSDSLTPTPEINIPPAPVNTQIDSALGAIETSAKQQDSLTQTTQQAAKTAEQGRNTALDKYLAEIQGLQSPTEIQQAAEQNVGLSDTEQQLNDINNQILQEQVGLQRAIEEAQKNKQGGFGGSVQAEINKLKTESFRRQADLSITQMALQGRYDSAKAQADRAVQIIIEQQQQQLDFRRFIYEENKEIFTKQEQRAFEIQLRDRERVVEENFYRLRAEYDQKLKQADPLYQLQVMTARKQLEMLGQETPKEREKRLKEEQQALLDSQTALPIIQNKINLIDGLLDSNAMDSVVGTTIFSRSAGSLSGAAGRFATGAALGAAAGAPFAGVGAIPGAIIGGTLLASQGVKDRFTGERQNFIAGVEQLIDQEFLDKLIDVKAQGATFGALSNAEGNALRSAATKIGTWRIRSGDPVTGRVVGYNASEDDFSKELTLIKDLTQKAYQRASGSVLTDEESSFFDMLEKEGVNFNPAY